MSDSSAGRGAPDGVGRVSRPDVVVVGGGVAGLVAALECARVGLRVTVLERRDELGGCVGRIELDGLTLDSGAESFAMRGGSVAELLERLGLADDIVDPNPAGAWLVWGRERGLETRPTPSGAPRATQVNAAPLPKTGMLGIPANPLGDDVRRIIGWGGAWRAYLDRIMPILTIGRSHSLGKLVRSRMGTAVLDKLVTPISAGVYSTDPDDLDLDVVAPGLNQAMTRMGSLSGGVADLVEGRRAGAAVRGIRGGMHRLVDTLVAELARFDVTVMTGAEVTGLTRVQVEAPVGEANGGEVEAWRVTAVRRGAEADAGETAEGDVGAVPGAALGADDVVGGADAATIEFTALDVVLAAPAHTSLGLVGEAVEGWRSADEWPAAASVELVTLVLDAPALAAAPRGTGVLVAAGTPGVTAKALTHSSAKWAWLGEAAEGRQVIRLSYGRLGTSNPLDGRPDDDVAALALADASTILGVDLDARMLRAAGRSAWRDALSHAALGQRDRVRALEDVVAAQPGLEVTGSWVAGTGLASVVPHALEVAHRIRHRRVSVAGDA
ncbi:FAD-dependent oxidoreductase [Agromyces sp. SYSU K20354]|uniref:protoporphyrinogen/coproporphyrinogen oxidase n=1 Tax=Agromyces cavernae TaxID=2898659 RepID=UPI001E48C161|nr:FAD-dependent oxidoreductase [Agromyces cavernae]MCD2440685.1 FAD-dependent oxidoreductase [Agromyces cavernae]